MAEAKLRVDRWMWFARVVKTRTLAQKMVRSGKVRVNREKISHTSFTVSVGDVLTINMPQTVLVYEILALGTRRGPFVEAQLLYRNLSPEKPTSSTPQAEPKAARPDKRQRRQLKAMKSMGKFGD